MQLFDLKSKTSLITGASSGLGEQFQSDLLGSPNKHDHNFWKYKIPVGFIAEPSDLDGLILYLASNNASKYVTGAAFIIDGGMSWGGKS